MLMDMSKTTEEAEEVTKEKPGTVEVLRERVEQLEKVVQKGARDVETFTSEKPLYALGITLLAGVFVGILIGAAVSRRRD